jgi:hypothetical protein
LIEKCWQKPVRNEKTTIDLFVHRKIPFFRLYHTKRIEKCLLSNFCHKKSKKIIKNTICASHICWSLQWIWDSDFRTKRATYGLLKKRIENGFSQLKISKITLVIWVSGQKRLYASFMSFMQCLIEKCWQKPIRNEKTTIDLFVHRKIPFFRLYYTKRIEKWLLSNFCHKKSKKIIKNTICASHICWSLQWIWDSDFRTKRATYGLLKKRIENGFSQLKTGKNE